MHPLKYAEFHQICLTLVILAATGNLTSQEPVEIAKPPLERVATLEEKIAQSTARNLKRYTSFIIVTLDLNANQLEVLDNVVDDSAREYAKQYQEFRKVLLNRPKMRPTPPVMLDHFEAELKSQFYPILKMEQVARFETVLTKRAVDQFKVASYHYLAMLDKNVGFTRAQRKIITQKLELVLLELGKNHDRVSLAKLRPNTIVRQCLPEKDQLTDYQNSRIASFKDHDKFWDVSKSFGLTTW